MVYQLHRTIYNADDTAYINLLHVQQCLGSDMHARFSLSVAFHRIYRFSHLAEAASYIEGSSKKIDSPIASSAVPHTGIIPGMLHHRILPY